MRFKLVVGGTLVVLLSLLVSAQDDPCSGVLLKAVADKISERFPDWTAQGLSDLPAEYRNMWVKAHPKECPGIAVGRYTSKAENSYATLLLSKKNTPGYKIVVLKSDTSGPAALRVLEEVNAETGTPSVIYRVDPGIYSDAERTERKKISFDGLVLEQLEAGSVLYYYVPKIGKFKTLIISE